MQNDKELSFRIYSAGAAQKPNGNRLELEDGGWLVGLLHLLLGILLDNFDTLVDEDAGGELDGDRLDGVKTRVTGSICHHFSNCLLYFL